MKKYYREGFTYPEFAHQYRAEFLDTAHWARVLQASGAGYVVITAKHHEGFCNWPSPTAWNWNSVEIGPRKDIIGELAKVVRENTTLKFGIYHSLFEWFNPLYRADEASGYKTQV